MDKAVDKPVVARDAADGMSPDRSSPDAIHDGKTGGDAPTGKFTLQLNPAGNVATITLQSKQYTIDVSSHGSASLIPGSTQATKPTQVHLQPEPAGVPCQGRRLRQFAQEEHL